MLTGIFVFMVAKLAVLCKECGLIWLICNLQKVNPCRDHFDYSVLFYVVVFERPGCLPSKTYIKFSLVLGQASSESGIFLFLWSRLGTF